MAFDTIALSYDQWYRTPLGSFADQVETALVFDLFRMRPGELILDAGCGTGNFSLKLARKGARVVGGDIVPGMLALARKKAAQEKLAITFVPMDLYCPAYPPDYFDGIVSVAVFEFIREPRKAFAALMRVLKPGGHLLIGTINRDSVWGAYYTERARRPGSIYRYARFMTLAELNGLDQGNLKKFGQCLFIGPATPSEKMNMEEERMQSGGRGGLIAALWEKPHTVTLPLCSGAANKCCFGDRKYKEA